MPFVKIGAESHYLNLEGYPPLGYSWFERSQTESPDQRFVEMFL